MTTFISTANIKRVFSEKARTVEEGLDTSLLEQAISEAGLSDFVAPGVVPRIVQNADPENRPIPSCWFLGVPCYHETHKIITDVPPVDDLHVDSAKFKGVGNFYNPLCALAFLYGVYKDDLSDPNFTAIFAFTVAFYNLAEKTALTNAKETYEDYIAKAASEEGVRVPTLAASRNKSISSSFDKRTQLVAEALVSHIAKADIEARAKALSDERKSLHSQSSNSRKRPRPNAFSQSEIVALVNSAMEGVATGRSLTAEEESACEQAHAAYQLLSGSPFAASDEFKRVLDFTKSIVDSLSVHTAKRITRVVSQIVDRSSESDE